MKTRHFLVVLCGVVIVTVMLILFGQQRPAAIQNIVSTTHQQFRNFQDTLRDAETKTLVADEKFLTYLGFTENPRVYPKDIWTNTSLPVIVSYVLEGQESLAIGLISNVARVLPNNTLLIYDLGLGSYGSRMLSNYCNNSRCQVVSFDFQDVPSHVARDPSHAMRPLIIQDALHRTGAILFMESHYRFHKYVTTDVVLALYAATAKDSGILAWPMPLKNAVSSLTHKKMFEYFHTDADNFLFVQMVSGDVLLLINTESVHKDIMLPWIQCALTQDCIMPIGAQSEGCKFNKRPQYRYSGCHSYDNSALNIVLGLKFKLDSSRYTNASPQKLFSTVTLDKAISILKDLEQNITTEGRTFDFLNI